MQDERAGRVCNWVQFEGCFVLSTIDMLTLPGHQSLPGGRQSSSSHLVQGVGAWCGWSRINDGIAERVMHLVQSSSSCLGKG